MTAAIQYMQSVWRTRLFWTSLALLDLRKRYRRSGLGVGWIMIQPTVMAAVICGVFAGSGAFDVGFGEHFPYVLTGLCVWNFIAAGVREGSGCLFWSETYIRQHRAPVVIYPLRIVLSLVMYLGISLVPVLIWSLLTGRLMHAEALASLVAGVTLAFLLMWGIAVVTGIFAVYMSDLTPLLDVLLQVGFYATPILYRADMLRKHGHGWVVDWNPAAAVISTIRLPLLEGTSPPLSCFAIFAGFVLAIWALAALVLVKFERYVIFRI